MKDTEEEEVGHAPRERVSWNLHSRTIRPAICRHAPRERVSWNFVCEWCDKIFDGHAPRERVSWNVEVDFGAEEVIVTLHVSVWVEMKKLIKCLVQT